MSEQRWRRDVANSEFVWRDSTGLIHRIMPTTWIVLACGQMPSARDVGVDLECQVSVTCMSCLCVVVPTEAP